MSTPDSQLHELLLSLFSAEELRRWLRSYDNYARILNSLPGQASPPAQLVDAAITALKRRGLIDHAFFRRLVQERASRAADINRVGVQWHSQTPSSGPVVQPSANGAAELNPAPSADETQLDTTRDGQPDVLIITALRDELQALLSVDDGLLHPWTKHGRSPSIHWAVLDGRNGPIRVAATRLTRMGGVATASAASRLIEQLDPRCLAMCGVCAGHPEDTALGDVVIADRLFHHDEGKVKSQVHYGDLWVDSLRDDWLHIAQELVGPAVGLHGYAEAGNDSWKWWLLEQLLAERDPRRSTAFTRYFPDSERATRLRALLDGNQITLNGDTLTLTDSGKDELHQHLFLHTSAIGELPYHIHVGPMGSGNAVQASGTIWGRLASGGMRKVLAVEIEAAAIGRVAHERSIPFAVAKGLMDHADSHKADGFKAFAARASAEVLCAFLRSACMPSGSTIHSNAGGQKTEHSSVVTSEWIEKLETLVRTERPISNDQTARNISAETDLFLSYRFDLGDKVQPVVEALERAGVRVWRDVEKLRSGDAITDQLRKALARTRTLAVLATKDYFDSEVCAWELASAWSAAAGIKQTDKRIFLLKPADVDSLAHIRVGPLQDSLAFDVPADNLDNFAHQVAEHLRQVDASPLGATSFLSPTFYPTRQAGSNRFVGRMADLWRLHGTLLRSRIVGVTGKVDGSLAQVRGLGGIGKTLLAIEYSRRFDTAWPGGIFWIDAVATFANGRRAFLANLAELVGVTPAADINETATLVEQKIAELTGNKPYLWILDNVPDGTTKDAIDVRMPPSSNGAVLLTTRWFALEYLGEKLDLGLLDADSSYRLLTQAHTPVGDNEIAAAREMTTLVGNHPLALDVLRALVKRKAKFSEHPFREWADELRDASVERFDAAAKSLKEQLPTNSARAVSAVLASSLDSCSERALDVLRVASVLAPESIPGSLFTGVLSRCDGTDAPEIEEAIEELESLALIRLGFDVHALVRKVVRDTRSTSERLDELAEAARAELAARFEGVSDIRTHGRLQPFVAHAVHCADASTLEAAKAGNLLGIYFHIRGDYSSARECFERALAARERILGPEHPDTLRTLQNLAGTLKAEGDLSGARERYERALAAYERILGPEHLDTLNTLQNLAVTLDAQGDLTSARDSYERALAAKERLLGPEHPDTLRTLQNLAGNLFAQGDLCGARDSYERALAAYERLLGPEHPETLTVLQNLAGTLGAQGDLSGARKRFERALAVRERLLGPEHPNTLSTLQNLAGTLYAQGELSGARERFERVLVAREQLLGSEHPDTLRTLQNLAGTLDAQGDLSSAQERYERALAAFGRILGSEHPDTLTVLQNLAGTLKAQGDLSGARERFEQALAAYERILGPEHPDTLMTLQNLAGTLDAQGDLSGARERYERALAAYERILGPEHPDTLTTLQNLALTLAQQNELLRARKMVQRVVDGRVRKLGTEHPDTVKSRELLALLDKAVDSSS